MVNGEWVVSGGLIFPDSIPVEGKNIRRGKEDAACRWVEENIQYSMLNIQFLSA
jgi:hypothetical protein